MDEQEHFELDGNEVIEQADQENEPPAPADGMISERLSC